MTNFDRRLDLLQRRPPRPTGQATLDGYEDASSLSWQAAERISHLVRVEPGTSIKIVVEGAADAAVVEVSWDADGVPLIRPV